MLKKTGQFTLCLVALTMMLHCGDNGTSEVKQAKRKAPKPIPIATTHTTIGPAFSVYTTTATLEAEYHAEVNARITGVVRELRKEEGDIVQEGDILLKLEDDQLRLEVRRSEIRLSQVEREHKRFTKMKDAGILADEDFQQSLNALENAQSELESHKLNLSFATVRAPFSGQVVRRYPDLGAHVQSGAMLFSIMDVNPLLVRAHIPANRMGNIGQGQTLQLKLDSNGQELEGKITLVSPIVDPDSGTVKVTAALHDYPVGTRPGDFAEVRAITHKRERALLIPSVAIFEEQGAQILYVVENGEAQRRSVTVGFIDRGMTEVKSGIEESDIIVIKGQRNLRQGQKVEIMEGPGSEQSLNTVAKKSGVGA